MSAAGSADQAPKRKNFTEEQKEGVVQPNPNPIPNPNPNPNPKTLTLTLDFDGPELRRKMSKSDFYFGTEGVSYLMALYTCLTSHILYMIEY